MHPKAAIRHDPRSRVDDEGRTYAQAALNDDQLMVLHYRPELTG
jgi:hypothetical protein